MQGITSINFSLPDINMEESMADVYVEKLRLLEWMETDAAGHQH
ncbi:unannotated protein [freshwater metagenome]